MCQPNPLFHALENFADANGHPPSVEATKGEASNPGPRMRRRGLRSDEARARRVCRLQDPPPNLDIWKDHAFRILHANIRGWASHNVELAARLRIMKQKPDLICINETFLDKSVGHITLEGYVLIARRDRADGRTCGGIVEFALANIAEGFSLIQSSLSLSKAI